MNKPLNEIEIPCLDHGFIRVVDHMGTDDAVVQAARVSYGDGTTTKHDDRGLIRYLMRHWHSTPFEMCEIKLHMKLPIFVARQWIRYRTANVNEYSGRYSIMSDEFYLPEIGRFALQSTANKQGSGDTLREDLATLIREEMADDQRQLYENYSEYVDEDGTNLSRELARINLPVSNYTEWYWKIDLHNLLRVLEQRADTHAQYETRVYAEALERILQQWCPEVYEAYLEYRKYAVSVSRTGQGLIHRMLAGQEITLENSGMSAGEFREFQAVWMPKTLAATQS